MKNEINKLIVKLKEEAILMVPEEYKDRGLEHKFLNGDNFAAGLNDAADQLIDLLNANRT